MQVVKDAKGMIFTLSRRLVVIDNGFDVDRGG
jgi:hypothetical protein